MALSADQAGQIETGSVVSGPEHYASKVFAGAPDVFSTPSLAALVEATAAGWLAKHIDAALGRGARVRMLTTDLIAKNAVRLGDHVTLIGEKISEVEFDAQEMSVDGHLGDDPNDNKDN